MNADERDRLRAKQDLIIQIAMDRHLQTNQPISVCQYGAPTVANLYGQLWPDFEPSMNSFLEHFNQ